MITPRSYSCLAAASRVAVVAPRDERRLTRLGDDVVAALEQQLAAALGELACTLEPAGRQVESAASRPASEFGGVNVVSNRRAPAFGTQVASAMSYVSALGYATSRGGSDSGSATKSAPVTSGPQSHFWPLTV